MRFRLGTGLRLGGVLPLKQHNVHLVAAAYDRPSMRVGTRISAKLGCAANGYQTPSELGLGLWSGAEGEFGIASRLLLGLWQGRVHSYGPGDGLARDRPYRGGLHISVLGPTAVHAPQIQQGHYDPPSRSRRIGATVGHRGSRGGLRLPSRSSRRAGPHP